MMQPCKCQSSGLGHKPVVALPYTSPEQETWLLSSLQKEAVNAEERELARMQCKDPVAKMYNCYKGKDK